MSGRELSGTLALRRHWCRPDEPVLLCLHCHGPALRFDVDGHNWRGVPGGGGRAVLNAVGAGMDSAFREENLDPPAMVVYGPGSGTAARVTLPDSPETRYWVLTPYRIGIVAMTRGEAAESGARRESQAGVLSRARRIAAGAADLGRALARDHPYPAGEPVPLSRVAGLAEVPAAQIAHLGLDRRKLPSGYRPRKVPVLRIGLRDGSGFDVTAPDDEAAERLARLAAQRS
ncbi:hypothetical protein [Actinomadura citrea]|uniref:Uncharacterized protein n=1 Tax=Actinomadura citrea TaxID=46158 RepID=A0A7Y9GJD5_9ACTN|nr:hypothetical protein [Actinomadura citrea]NYE17608.1 hypothetical protein [Actinomadura citrea]GGT60495.1 hypothetical protein GCM10010177_16040 [Actinomadura citrea]